MSEPRKPKVHRTKEEKLRIMQECQKHGVVVVCKKYGIYPATYYSWVRKFKSMGAEGLQHGMTKEYLKEIRRLERENARLKDLVVQKELESSMKGELLKKKYAPKKFGKS
jgi:putative transposase